MAASYEHKGYMINRTPVPMMVEEQETTGWEYNVRCPEGNPVPIIVRALDRKKGLRETRNSIERYIALTVAEPGLMPAQS